jgi:hypothetical protein
VASCNANHSPLAGSCKYSPVTFVYFAKFVKFPNQLANISFCEKLFLIKSDLYVVKLVLLSSPFAQDKMYLCIKRSKCSSGKTANVASGTRQQTKREDEDSVCACCLAHPTRQHHLEKYTAQKQITYFLR